MSHTTQSLETTKGTFFGTYNADTGYFQNIRKYKDDESKLKSIVLGGAAQMRAQKAFDLCSQFMNTGTSAPNLN